MHNLVVVFAMVAMLLFSGRSSARPREWRALRIDAGSITTFDESVQRMRNALPYNRALLFVLVLKDLRARSAPAAYRERLNGLSYKEIARLASPAVTTEYLALYGGNAAGAFSSGGNEGIGAPPFYDHP